MQVLGVRDNVFYFLISKTQNPKYQVPLPLMAPETVAKLLDWLHAVLSVEGAPKGVDEPWASSWEMNLGEQLPLATLQAHMWALLSLPYRVWAAASPRVSSLFSTGLLLLSELWAALEAGVRSGHGGPGGVSGGERRGGKRRDGGGGGGGGALGRVKDVVEDMRERVSEVLRAGGGGGAAGGRGGGDSSWEIRLVELADGVWERGREVLGLGFGV
jgi:hypothetical protein